MEIVSVQYVQHDYVWIWWSWFWTTRRTLNIIRETQIPNGSNTNKIRLTHIYTKKEYTLHTHTHTKMYTLCINRKCVCATACRFCTIAKAIAIAIFMTRYIGRSTLRSTLFIRFCEPTSYPTMRKMRKIFQNDARARNNNIVDGNGRYFKQTIRLFRWEKEI